MMLPFEMLADPQTRKEVSLLALRRLMHFIMMYAKSFLIMLFQGLSYTWSNFDQDGAQWFCSR